MKRPHEKIKDLVEPQAFDEVTDFGANLARALTTYRFTDTTSLLLAAWLDTLADLSRERGAARALAGMRGVGKSHALAAFSALATSPELRAGVADSHVAASARRLLSRRHQLVRVERGTRPTLKEELAAGLARTFNGTETEWLSDDAGKTLAVAASRMGDATLVLVIDTAYGRSSRVSRDDGAFLSELAGATETANAFIALALDDDIAGADGANVALAGSFQIDYLDPEHLYRVADLYVLRKNAPARATLREIYLTLRAAVPGFNWSETRFAALYPIHPLVADVSAAVRLYAQTFAFLPFASASAIRATGRPALSLVLLDEVFDRTESEMRQAKDLNESFAAYDELATSASAQFPVMQRLQAKLILKGLFILSLEGRGATAREMCVTLLFYDENQTAHPTVMERVAEILSKLAEVAPHAITQMTEDDGSIRYRFQISASKKFESALAAAVEQLAPLNSSAFAAEALLHDAARARFDDYPFAHDAEAKMRDAEAKTSAIDFWIRWRGGERPGRIVHCGDAEIPSHDGRVCDWEVFLLSPGEKIDAAEFLKSLDATQETNVNTNDVTSIPIRLVWQPAPLKADELLVLRRLIALRTDEKLIANFGEAAHAVANSLTAQAERIWARIYLDDGAFYINGERHIFDDEARTAPMLAAAFAQVFAPLLDARFPEHPNFAELLDEHSVAALIDGLFVGAKTNEASVQQLAATFAEPLGVATIRGDKYTLETGDAGLRHKWIRDVLALTDAANGEIVPLEKVHGALHGAPYGLLREARQLILTALVAQRRIELVTATGDRITRRTLDRSIKLDDIAGICRTAAILHSAEELTIWARLLTTNKDLPSISDPAGCEIVRSSLAAWLDVWRAHRVLENFNELPDRGLTRRVWNLGKAVGKTFGAAVDAIESALAEDISLEECLQRVADAFGDSMETLAGAFAQLEELTQFINKFKQYEIARAYTVAADPTNISEIETARRELLIVVADPHSLFDENKRARFNELWEDFHVGYTEHYAQMHERSVGGTTPPDELNERRRFEELIRGAMWREFETLSSLSIVNGQLRHEATTLAERGRRALLSRCDLPTRRLLIERPHCACAFRLTRVVDFARLTQELQELIELSLAAYQRTLLIIAKPLAQSLEDLANMDMSINTQRARELAAAFAVERVPSPLARADIELIERATEMLEVASPVRLKLPFDNYGLMTRDELIARLRQWLDDLPAQSLLVEVGNENIA